MKNNAANFAVKVAHTMLEWLTVIVTLVAFLLIFALPVAAVISLVCHIPWWIKILIVVFTFVLEAICVTYMNTPVEEEDNNEQKEKNKIAGGR